MILHNGILSPDCVDALLPTAWSYRSSFQTLPQTPNYLKERPDVIPIDCGRQLFVDDFLIEESSLHREFYSPEIKGMVLTPETVLEMDHGNCPVAAPFKDGIFYDPTDKKFKLWYQAGWFGAVAYAESRDGFHWIRPHIAVDGSNRILPAFEDRFRDGCSIWLDQNADTERFKMFLFTRDRQKREYAELRTSANGLDWSAPSRIMSCGDTTSLFYNPFRDRWVLSVRSLYQKGKYLYRYRSYREAASFSELADCRREYFWQSSDANDERDDIWDCDTQLYSLDCVAYESIMLGIFQIFKGPHNAVAEQLGEPKKCDLYIGFSRDGIQFSRTGSHLLREAAFMVHGMRVISIQHLVYVLSTATNCCSISAHGLVILRVWGDICMLVEAQEWQHFAEMALLHLRQTLPDVCRRLLCVSTEKDFG